MPPKNGTVQAISNSRTADKFVVRLSDGLRARIADKARGNHRSMNSEILARLDESMELEQLYNEQRVMNEYLLSRVLALEAALPKPLKLAANT
ncbi:Arc family DNA-binding protein [Pseudomonas lactis]|uniref:Arc family DNA-binding protein n=1 Tax=Pseudomonas lactis TaxID=1615674 RepID=UPI003F7CE37E